MILQEDDFEVETFKCTRCGEDVLEIWPHETVNGKVYCGDCAFISGLISEDEYLDDYCFWLDVEGKRAAVRNGEIYLETGKFEWERKSNDRNYPDYIAWRAAVFERDKYTCRKCGKVGGELNAHHIKPYAKYPDLRTDVNNGITLCKKCHKEIHREKK